MDLELATTDDLIAELKARASTRLVVLVVDDHRGGLDGYMHGKVTPSEALRLIEQITEEISSE